MQPTDFAVLTSASYLTNSVWLTVWVARTLVKTGRIFLVDAPGAPQRLALPRRAVPHAPRPTPATPPP